MRRAVILCATSPAAGAAMKSRGSTRGAAAATTYPERGARLRCVDMCLVLLAVRPSARITLVVAANRDELHARPSNALAEWDDVPGLVGGRDLKAGGTWLGVTRSGRFATLTNVRSPSARREGRSRGELVRDFLVSDRDPVDYASTLAGDAEAYPSFNLIVADREDVLYVSDQAGSATELSPGIHGLSNARIDEPWPKVEDGKRAMANAVRVAGEVDVEALFAALREERRAEDERLPSTGVPLEIERFLSSAFLRSREYGTRCSTVVVRRGDGSGVIEERRFDASGGESGRTRLVL